VDLGTEADFSDLEHILAWELSRVYSLFASTDDWDDQLKGTELGWLGSFRILRIYLTTSAPNAPR
jgi:hypothetical protein